MLSGWRRRTARATRIEPKTAFLQPVGRLAACRKRFWGSFWERFGAQKRALSAFTNLNEERQCGVSQALCALKMAEDGAMELRAAGPGLQRAGS